MNRLKMHLYKTMIKNLSLFKGWNLPFQKKGYFPPSLPYAQKSSKNY